MASSSSSSSPRTFDVFLSFCGPDTRRHFVSFLYDRLDQKGIKTFKDDKEIENGKKIYPELIQAIEGSKFAVVVMSENYASSRWCLEELAKIMERHEEGTLTVIPVFYEVEPSDVRRQAGKFVEYFKKHEERQIPEKVQSWRDALAKLGNIRGECSQKWKDEHPKLVDKIVKDISDQLNRPICATPNDFTGLVGMGVPMEFLPNLKFFQICPSRYGKETNVFLTSYLNVCAAKRKYLRWDRYPSKPTQFRAEKLVELDLWDRKRERIWEGYPLAPRVFLSGLTDKKKDWIIRVRVIRMWEALNIKKNNELLSVDMILLDEEGTAIQGTIHRNKVAQFHPIIKEGCLYEIECFQLTESLKKYRTTNHKYSLHFLLATKLREISEPDRPIPEFWFRFATFERLLAESNKNIHLLDVIGQLISISKITATGEKGTLKRDINLQLISGKNIIVTLWESLAKKLEGIIPLFSGPSSGPPTILIVTFVKSRKYKDTLSLSTSSATQLYCDPEIKEIKEFIKSLKTKGQVTSMSIRNKLSNPERIKQNMRQISFFKKLVSEEPAQDYKFFCKARIRGIIEDNGWSYVSCSVCMKKLVKVGSSYQCEKCNITNAVGTLRYRIEVIVEDETDNATTFTLFDRDVSSLLDVSATQLKEQDTIPDGTNASLIIPEKIKGIIGKTLIFQLKITPFNFTSSKENFTVSEIILPSASDELERKETMDITNGSEGDAQVEETLVFTRKKRKLSSV